MIGGLTYGTFKQANLVAVKIMDPTGIGYTWQVMVGLEAVWKHAIETGPDVSAVVNLSMGLGNLEDVNPVDEMVQTVSDIPFELL